MSSICSDTSKAMPKASVTKAGKGKAKAQEPSRKPRKNRKAKGDATRDATTPDIAPPAPPSDPSTWRSRVDPKSTVGDFVRRDLPCNTTHTGLQLAKTLAKQRYRLSDWDLEGLPVTHDS